MYTITFSEQSLRDLLDHRYEGRQFYAAVLLPDSGIFTRLSSGDGQVPKIVCPYQVNDIIIIQEKWARSGSDYVYKIDGPSDFNYRPATTMPDSAARIWGRITSVTPWILTQEILDKYLSLGVFSDNYAGTAKVINYYDTGTKLLSTIRNSHNRKLLNALHQPQIDSEPPKVTKNLYYQLHQATTYRLHPYKLNGSIVGSTTLQGPINSKYAIAKALSDTEDGQVRDFVLYSGPDPTELPEQPPDPPLSGVPIDTADYGSWVFSSTYTPKTAEELAQHYTYVGLDKRSTASRPRYVYLYKTVQNNTDVYVPNYATYTAQIIDPNCNLFAWLISGYLCDKDGYIVGTYF